MDQYNSDHDQMRWYFFFFFSENISDITVLLEEQHVIAKLLLLKFGNKRLKLDIQIFCAVKYFFMHEIISWNHCAMWIWSISVWIKYQWWILLKIQKK